MSDESVTQVPSVFSSKERSALVAKALSEAARRARFSTKSRRGRAGASYKARRSERIARLLQIATFVAFVAIPTSIAIVYFGFLAANLYTAEARFTVRGGIPMTMESVGAMSEAPGALIIQDTQVIMNYIESRAIVEQLDKSIGLAKLYQDPNADPFSRLGQHKPIEKILKYWQHHVDLTVQMPAGIVVMTIKAFKPDEAVTIANAVLASSESLVNQMNDLMRSDAMQLARTERERAQKRLAEARTELEKARNDEGILTTKDASSGLNEMLTTVRGQLLKLQQTYDSLRRFENADAPQIKHLQSQMEAAKKQVVQVQAQMTGTKVASNDPKPLSGSMSRLDYATLNNDIAEKIYAGALTVLEHATLAGETKLMYINTFVSPVPAEEPRYPRRALDISLVAGAGLGLWAAALGVVALLRKGLV